MSSESTPVLSRAIIEFEKFMTELEALGEKYEVLKPWTDIGVTIWLGLSFSYYLI